MRKRLKRGDQFVFKSIRIRLARVDEEDPDDQKDDSVELAVVTGTRSVILRVTELETIFFEEYEITVDDVRPRGSPNRGEGTAYVLVSYHPAIR